MAVQFGGADQLAALSRRAAQFAASNALVEAARDGIEESVPTIEKAAAARALTIIPSGNGLAAIVASLRLGTKVTSRRREVSVRVRVTPRTGLADPSSVNRGRLYHPTYGHRPSVIQRIPPGWFTLTVLDKRKDMYRKIETRLARAYKKL